MPKATGLMNPENAAKSQGMFKEGCVKITACSYKVHQGKPGEGEAPIPSTKWCWVVTRLSEGGQEPLLDEHDEPITEELYFSFGGKSLPFVHPGKADGPDDNEPEDLGTSLGAEGNTIFLNAADWKPNEKSGLMVLTSSLVALSINPEFLNRCWAPDWVGCVFEMKSKAGEKGADGRAFTYKVVSKVLVGPGKGSSLKAVSTNGRNTDAEAQLSSIIMGMSSELDGQSITLKAFLNRVRGALDTNKTEPKLLVPILSLCKDEKWLAKHAETLDYQLNAEDKTIAFGNLPF